MRKTRANKEREGTEYRGYMKRERESRRSVEGQMVRSRIKMYSNHACNLLVVIHINHIKNTKKHVTSFDFTRQLLWRPAGNHWRKTEESDQDIRSWTETCVSHMSTTAQRTLTTLNYCTTVSSKAIVSKYKSVLRKLQVTGVKLHI